MKYTLLLDSLENKQYEYVLKLYNAHIKNIKVLNCGFAATKLFSILNCPANTAEKAEIKGADYQKASIIILLSKYHLKGDM